MIYYFSGTGNSRYCAARLASLTADSFSFIPDTSFCSGEDKVLGFVFPVYSWGVPPLVLQFIKQLPSDYRPDYIYAVFVCGDETGNAPRMFEKALAAKGLSATAIVSLIMPNNYVLLPGFDVDSKEVELLKLSNCDERIKWIGECISNRDCVRDYVAGPYPRLKTALVYPLFRKWGIIRKLWKHTDKCTRCGICAGVCPMKNITIGETGPVFADNCVSCLACYHHCPYKTIQYGQFTKDKGQYFFKKSLK